MCATEPKLTYHMIPQNMSAVQADKKLKLMHKWLTFHSRPNEVTNHKYKSLTKYAEDFFVDDRGMWCCDTKGAHKWILYQNWHIKAIHAMHDNTRHHEYYTTHTLVLERSWWLFLRHDIMFFSLTNSPATFQMMMNHIFHPLIAKHELLGTSICVYMDDIAIATHTCDSNHIATITNVLQLTAEHNLYFKPEKCIFHAPRIDYLGVILEKGVTSMDPIKIAAITEWPMPTKVKDVHSFLGFCNFYHTFIRGFTSITKPPNALTCKGVEWNWSSEHQRAFEDLKK